MKLATAPWICEQISWALARGAHESCMVHPKFVHEKFIDMMNKGQFVILPASAVMHLPGLWVSPRRGTQG